MFVVYYEAVAGYTTVDVQTDGHVLTVTLDRPHRLNAFDETMCEEFERLWRAIALDDDVRAVVLRAAGDRAFSTGVDVDRPDLPAAGTPGRTGILAPAWAPRPTCAGNRWSAPCTAWPPGGAFYWINEADIVICSEDATFFEPHVSYGMTAALEPIGLLSKIPLGDVLRMALLGLDERLSPARALQIGLVTEVLRRDELWPRADELATVDRQPSPPWPCKARPCHLGGARCRPQGRRWIVACTTPSWATISRPAIPSGSTIPIGRRRSTTGSSDELRLGPADAAFRAELREFLRAELPPHWLGLIPGQEYASEFTLEFCRKLGERGLLDSRTGPPSTEGGEPPVGSSSSWARSCGGSANHGDRST